MNETINTCIPPINWKRNEFGLYEHVNYVFNEDSSIDWRSMIDPKYIVPNKKNTTETDITKLEDKDLLILLHGFKKITKLRGVVSVENQIVIAQRDFAAVNTTIRWLPNYETDNISLKSVGAADAHPENTRGFGSYYLTSMAENRAFSRAVRSFLSIETLGESEISGSLENGSSQQESQTEEPSDVLKKLLDANNIKFSSFQNQMIHREVENASTWESVKDIPTNQIFEIIGLVQKIIKNKESVEEK